MYIIPDDSNVEQFYYHSAGCKLTRVILTYTKASAVCIPICDSYDGEFLIAAYICARKTRQRKSHRVQTDCSPAFADCFR